MTTPDPGDGSTPQTLEDMLAARMDDASQELTMGSGVSLDEALEVTRSRAEQPIVTGVAIEEANMPPVGGLAIE